MNQLHDIRFPLDLPIPLYIWLGFAMFITVSAWQTLALLKRRNASAPNLNKQSKKPVPVLTPEEIALKAVSKLEQYSEGNDQDLKYFYIKLSEIVRKYLVLKHGVAIMEATTSEIFSLMKEQNWQKQELIREFLLNTDLVKFAKVYPGEDDVREILRCAKEIVNAASPPLPPLHAKSHGEGELG